MPRVMHLLTSPDAVGPTRQVVALWHALAGLGWQTLLVVGQCDGDPAVDLREAGIPRVARDKVDTSSAGFVVLPQLRRGVHPVGDVLAHWRLEQAMRAFAPHCVHTHTSKAAVLARSAARELEIGVVAHTFHGHGHDAVPAWRAWLVRRVEAWLARRTDLLFPPAAGARQLADAYEPAIAAAAARAERRRRWTRPSPAALDWVLCAPLIWCSLLVALTPFTSFVSDDVARSSIGQATILAVAIMAVCVWRWHVVRSRWYRCLLGNATTLCVFGLAVMAWHAIEWRLR